MNQRNDPSSISFGRLLRQTANTVHQQQGQIEELKKGQLSSTEKQQASQLAAERKAERTRALQMIASSGTTAEDFASLNQAMLTPAQREQIRHNVNAMQGAVVSPIPTMSPEAQLRIRNWQQASQANGSGVNAFSQTAAREFSSNAPTPYERWLTNQQRPETQRHNERMRLESNQRAAQHAQLLRAQQVPRPSGIDFSNSNTPN